MEKTRATPEPGKIQTSDESLQQKVTSINDVPRFWPFLTYLPCPILGAILDPIPNLISDIINGRSQSMDETETETSNTDTEDFEVDFV